MLSLRARIFPRKTSRLLSKHDRYSLKPQKYDGIVNRYYIIQLDPIRVSCTLADEGFDILLKRCIWQKRRGWGSLESNSEGDKISASTLDYKVSNQRCLQCRSRVN